MRYSTQVQTCGYETCPCRGINFISGDGTRADYCVNGKRTGTIKGSPLPRELFFYQLEKYADFLRWHQVNVRPYSQDAPEPFQYTSIERQPIDETNYFAIRGEHYV